MFRYKDNSEALISTFGLSPSFPLSLCLPRVFFFWSSEKVKWGDGSLRFWEKGLIDKQSRQGVTDSEVVRDTLGWTKGFIKIYGYSGEPMCQ